MATEAAVETTVLGLDPIARGILDLSLRHDFSDTSIARVVGGSDHDVAQLRQQTMARVAAELGYEGADAYERARDELLTVSAELWIAPPRRAPEPAATDAEQEADREPDADPAPETDRELNLETEPAPVVEPKPKPEPEPDPEPELDQEQEPEAESEPELEPEEEPEPERDPRSTEDATAGDDRGPSRRSSGLPLLGLLLAAVLIVVLFLSRSGDDQADDETSAAQTAPGAAPAPADEPQAEPAPAPQPQEEPAPTPPAGDAITLEPLRGAPTEGTATVSVSAQGGAPVARVELDGLRRPRGVYALWLFSSLITSQPLGTIDSGDGVISAPLPADAGSYAYLDLSLERSAGDRLHSGRSVMRIPTSALLQPAG